MSLMNQINDHSGAVTKAGVGIGGVGGSIALQNFNELMAGLAAFATFIYICLQIYRFFHPRDGSK